MVFLFGILEWRVYNVLWKICKSFTLWLPRHWTSSAAAYLQRKDFFLLPKAMSFHSLLHSEDLHLPLNWGTFSTAWSWGSGSPVWSASVNILSVFFIPSKYTALSLLKVRNWAISFQTSLDLYLPMCSHSCCKVCTPKFYNIIHYLGFIFHTVLPLLSPLKRCPTTHWQQFWEMGDRSLKFWPQTPGKCTICNVVNYHIKSCHSHLLQPSFK